MFTMTEESKFKVMTLDKRDNKLLLLDQGLYNVATCRTDISRIDGESGELFYRHVPIEQLVQGQDFLDIAYTLIFSDNSMDLPKEEFKETALLHANLLPEIKKLLDSIDIARMHPMNVLSLAINYLPAWEAKYLPAANLNNQICFIIAQVMIIAAYYVTKVRELSWIEIGPETSFAERFVRQLYPSNQSGLSVETITGLLNLVLILHAEHGQNCSTATVRNIASAKADPYQAMISGIAAFKGDLHGGASQRVAEMYDSLSSANTDVADFVNDALKNKKRIMGFGHRVYSAWDPRAAIMHTKLEEINSTDPAISLQRELALKLIAETTNREYFTSRGIYPNPDLLNGIFFRMIGVPREMNTVMLTMSRVVGWLAHYREHSMQNLPIVRPRQLPVANQPC